MDLGFLNALAGTGGSWVIWLLLASSVWVVALMVERFLVLKKEREAFAAYREALHRHLREANLTAAKETIEGKEGAPAVILSAGLSRAETGSAAAEERVAGARLVERKRLEANHLVLGTLGNNAPFIGLFGTVLGVIKAFKDLAASSQAGPEVVMSGLAEALIATAVGLLVAIPAVIGFNFFQKTVNDLFTDTDALVKLLIAALKEKETHGRNA